MSGKRFFYVKTMRCSQTNGLIRLKTKLFLIFMCYLLCIHTGQLLAQDSIVKDFITVQFEGKVQMSWVIQSGNTCDGIRVFRSQDGINYEQIGSIPGICGSPYASIAYDFTDTSPLLNQLNYYKLELGNLGFSRVARMFVVDLTQKAYLIIPHPAVGTTKIFIDNPLQKEYELVLRDAGGKIVGTTTTNTSYFELYVNDLTNGMYIFSISNEGEQKIINGKLVVHALF